MTDRPVTTRDLADPASSTMPATEPTEQEEAEAPRDDRARAAGTASPGAVETTATRREDADQHPLLPEDQTDRLAARWQEIQGSFVDQPRDSVEQADALVADLMQRLAAGFSEERERLERQWDQGDDVSTEDLRVALTHYRSFFDRLLSA